MAYKVGTTIVIDDSGTVDWSRIGNKPAIGTGTITSVGVVNTTPTAGAFLTGSIRGGPTIVANCYVESLTGGGASGAVAISAVTRGFNCNCNCRC